MKQLSYNFFLNRRIYNSLKNIRKTKDFNYKKVKTIAIMFNTELHSYENMKEFTSKLNLKNVKYTFIGYSKKAIKEEGFITFNISNLNWFAKPRTKELISFTEKPFSMLIDFSNRSNLHCKNIIILSKSKFKIGLYNSALYNFMVNHSNINLVAKILNNYLKIINLDE